MQNKNIKFVLVNTFHAGNIGSSARAIKTMGFKNLSLVQPKSFPNPDANTMAANAQDVLQNAQVTTNLQEAIGDCNFVFGASARSRDLQISALSARQAGEMIATLNASAKIGIIFGRERSGLTNEELGFCTHQIYIPADANYGVLNLSQAVQVVAYEIFQAQLAYEQSITNAEYDFSTNTEKEAVYPTAQAVKDFEEHMHASLKSINYIKQRSNVNLKLNAIFRRAKPTERELSMLRGIFTKIDKLVEKSAKN